MQTEPDRQKSHDGDDCDQDDQRHCPGIDTEQHVQTSHHLTDAQAERGGDTKDRAKDSQQIDRVTDRYEDSIAKNRIEQGPKRQWQFIKKEQIWRICGGLRSKKLKKSQAEALKIRFFFYEEASQASTILRPLSIKRFGEYELAIL